MCCAIEMKCLLERHRSHQHFQWETFRKMGFPVQGGWQGVIWIRKDAFHHSLVSEACSCLCCRTKSSVSLPLSNRTPVLAAAKQLYGPLCLCQKWSSVPQGSDPAHMQTSQRAVMFPLRNGERHIKLAQLLLALPLHWARLTLGCKNETWQWAWLGSSQK